MVVRSYIFGSLCKTCLAIIVSSALSVACSSPEDPTPKIISSPPSGPTSGPTAAPASPESKSSNAGAEDPKQSLLRKVSEAEAQLKDFGIYFDVNERSNYGADTYRYSYDRRTQTVVEVAFRMTATDQDLVVTGRKPEDRDRLIGQVADLWTDVQANGFEKNRTDNELVAAVMKVKLLSFRRDIPLVLDMAGQILGIGLAKDELTMEQKDEGLFLWPLKASNLTNAEAITKIEERLALNANFEKAKTKINEMASDSTGNDTLQRTQQTIRNIRLLTAQEVVSSTKLRDELAQRPATERLDTKSLAAINRDLVKEKRAQLLTQVDQQVSKEMSALGLQFAASGADDSIKVDQQSLSEARVKGKLEARDLYSKQQTVREKAEIYLSFIKKHDAESDRPQDEVLVLNKFSAFSKL